MQLFDPWDLWISRTLVERAYPISYAKYLTELSGPEDVDDNHTEDLCPEQPPDEPSPTGTT